MREFEREAKRLREIERRDRLRERPERLRERR